MAATPCVRISSLIGEAPAERLTRSLAGYVLPEKRVEALLDEVDRIEEVEDVNALVELLRSR